MEIRRSIFQTHSTAISSTMKKIMNKQEVKLASITPNGEDFVVLVARESSQRKDKLEDAVPLLQYLIKNNHWSPFEHTFMSVSIQTTKAIAIQLLRHRSFYFQEFSQRYAKVTEYIVPEMRLQSASNRQSSTDTTSKYEEEINYHLHKTFALYEEMIENGIAKETARMILPMCSLTTLKMSGSIRSWIHFLALRDDEHAQKEIQEIAKMIKSIFTEQFPTIAKCLHYNEQ